MSEGSKFFAKEVYNKGDELDENFLSIALLLARETCYSPEAKLLQILFCQICFYLLKYRKKIIITETKMQLVC